MRGGMLLLARAFWHVRGFLAGIFVAGAAPVVIGALPPDAASALWELVGVVLFSALCGHVGSRADIARWKREAGR